MTTRPAANLGRRGITLVEILISILILGVGMLSLATLFPLGLERLRQANRASRSALLAESAGETVASRNMLYKPNFLATWYPYDPFTRDPVSLANAFYADPGIDRLHPYTGIPAGSPVSFPGGTGIPVCYDPLWWYQLYNANGGGAPGTGFTPATQAVRFGYGLGLVRNDPDGSSASAYGLQRLTNFPVLPNGASYYMPDVGPISGSPDDIVMQVDGNANSTKGIGSPVVNDLSTYSAGQPQTLQDLSYSWMFTGKQTDVDNGMVFDGDIVLFQNRPFAIDSSSGGAPVVAGETVVEAIFGYGQPAAGSAPYSLNDTTVLLRWDSTKQADPDVRVGGWIADVTYEKLAATEASRWYLAGNGWTRYYPAQRCYWYQVIKRTDPTSDHDSSLTNYREMVVTLASPVRAKTPLSSAGTVIQNAHVNVALIAPSVVNVVPKVFYTR